MNQSHYSKRFTAKCALTLGALLCCSANYAASLIKDQIALDPVLVDGGSLLKFTLVTKDNCVQGELPGCDGKDFQLHSGQQFTIVGNNGIPIIEAGSANTAYAANFDNTSAILTIPHLIDTEYRQPSPNYPASREVNATLILSAFANDQNGASTLVFTITKLEELIKTPTDVGALQVFNGQSFDLLPPGPEDAILAMRNGKPAWVKHYKIGDEGPHGGTVFFVSDNGLHGLEAAPKGSAGALEVIVDPQTGTATGNGATWGCDGVKGANLTSVGTGRQNTFDILKDCNLSNTSKEAAAIAAKFKLPKDEKCYFDNPIVAKTKDDVCWYLPSLGELELMRQQQVLLNLVPGNNGDSAGNGRYWSSTQRALVDDNGKQVPSPDAFSDQGFQKKTKSFNIRAIRDF